MSYEQHQHIKHFVEDAKYAVEKYLLRKPDEKDKANAERILKRIEELGIASPMQLWEELADETKGLPNRFLFFTHPLAENLIIVLNKHPYRKLNSAVLQDVMRKSALITNHHAEQIYQLQEEILCLRRNNEALNEHLKALIQERDQYKKAAFAYENLSQSLREENSSLKDELKILRRIQEKAMENQSELSETKTLLQEKIAEVVQEKVKLWEENTSLRSNIDLLNVEIKKLTEKLSEVEAQRKKAIEDNEFLAAKSDQLAKAIIEVKSSTSPAFFSFRKMSGHHMAIPTKKVNIPGFVEMPNVRF